AGDRLHHACGGGGAAPARAGADRGGGAGGGRAGVGGVPRTGERDGRRAAARAVLRRGVVVPGLLADQRRRGAPIAARRPTPRRSRARGRGPRTRAAAATHPPARPAIRTEAVRVPLGGVMLDGDLSLPPRAR